MMVFALKFALLLYHDRVYICNVRANIQYKLCENLNGKRLDFKCRTNERE